MFIGNQSKEREMRMKGNSITVKIKTPDMNLRTYGLNMSKEEFVLSLANRFPKRVDINKILVAMNIYPQCLYMRHLDSTQNCHYGVFVKDITFIEMKEDLCYLHSTCEQAVSTCITLDELAHYLPTENFLRIDNRCIINVDYIKRITGKVVTMNDGETLEISDDFYPLFITHFHFIG